MSAVIKPTQSLYKSALSKHSGHVWSLKGELTSVDRLLHQLCLSLLVVGVALYGAGISSQELVINQGDGQNVYSGKLGYSRICFTGVDSSGGVLAEDCAHVDSSCSFIFSDSTQSFMAANYGGLIDSKLNGCSEFNAYRAFHVLGLVFTAIALLMMLPVYLQPSIDPLMKRLRVYTFCVAFCAGSFGVIAQCLFVDWLWTNEQFLITLGYLSESSGNGSTPTYVSLDHSFFDLVGGWICAICSALFFIWTFKSAT